MLEDPLIQQFEQDVLKVNDLVKKYNPPQELQEALATMFLTFSEILIRQYNELKIMEKLNTSNMILRKENEVYKAFINAIKSIPGHDC